MDDERAFADFEVGDFSLDIEERAEFFDVVCRRELVEFMIDDPFDLGDVEAGGIGQDALGGLRRPSRGVDIVCRGERFDIGAIARIVA